MGLSYESTVRLVVAPRTLLLLLALLGTVLTAPALSAGLHLDDFVILGILSHRSPLTEVYPSPVDLFIFVGGNRDRTARMLRLGPRPGGRYGEMHIAFWPPPTAVTHAPFDEAGAGNGLLSERACDWHTGI